MSACQTLPVTITTSTFSFPLTTSTGTTTITTPGTTITSTITSCSSTGTTCVSVTETTTQTIARRFPPLSLKGDRGPQAALVLHRGRYFSTFFSFASSNNDDVDVYID